MRFKYLVAVVTGVLGCSRSSPQPSHSPGCILGYDSGGIGVIELATGAKRYICKSTTTRCWSMPQGNRVLILGKTGQELFKGAFAPAASLAFAAEASF
jgi:hypothetical protein